MRTGSATATFCRASGAGKTAFTRRDGHRVGDGDALPGGREEGRDAGMQGERRGAPIAYRGFNNNNNNVNNNSSQIIRCRSIQLGLVNKRNQCMRVEEWLQFLLFHYF